MNTIPLKSLREIKHEYGFPQTSPVANWLKELILTYNESNRKFPQISHLQANILTQKVQHDSFSQSLNRTIINLETLIHNDCFPSSNHEHSQLSQPTPVYYHTTPPINSSGRQSVIYRQYANTRSPAGRQRRTGGKKKVRQARKGWQDLIRDSLLLDLYKAYVVEVEEGLQRVATAVGNPAALCFINDVLRHFNSNTMMPAMRLRPSIRQLSLNSFRTIARRYRDLAQ